jgi:acyl-CoA thioester hydrolase
VSFQYELSIVVPSEDIDEMEHVNNVAYLRYAELIARAHAESVGLGFDGSRELGGLWVARRHSITYHRPAFVGETLAVRTRIRDAKGVRATREVMIFRGDELLVDVETEWVWVDSETQRPKRMPPEVGERLPPIN